MTNRAKYVLKNLQHFASISHFYNFRHSTQNVVIYNILRCYNILRGDSAAWWHDYITDCATLQPLSTIAPHIMEQVFFLPR